MQSGLLGVIPSMGTHKIAEFQLAIRPESEQFAARGVGELKLQRSFAPLRGSG